MSAVDPGIAAWLRGGALFASSSDAPVAAAFGASAIETEIRTPLATKAGAEAEAARQLAFLKGPLVEDTAVIPGLRADLIGQAITLRGTELGYDTGKAVFVIAAEEADAADLTVLRVLRRLD